MVDGVKTNGRTRTQTRAGAVPATDGYAGGSPFPPIADYAFEWLCLPRPDGPSVFAAILDRTAGGFRVGPADFSVPGARRYLPGTNVLETTWMTSTGWLSVRDALLIGPWYHSDKRSPRHRRPPRDGRPPCAPTVASVLSTIYRSTEFLWPARSRVTVSWARCCGAGR